MIKSKAHVQPYWANSPNIWLAKMCATEMLQNLGMQFV